MNACLIGAFIYIMAQADQAAAGGAVADSGAGRPRRRLPGLTGMLA